jgi:hypothetical protein
MKNREHQFNESTKNMKETLDKITDVLYDAGLIYDN